MDFLYQNLASSQEEYLLNKYKRPKRERERKRKRKKELGTHLGTWFKVGPSRLVLLTRQDPYSGALALKLASHHIPLIVTEFLLC